MSSAVADLHSKVLDARATLGPNSFIAARNEVGARLCFYRRLSFC